TEGNRLNEQVATSSLGKFMISDAYKYGFIIRYPKDKIAITNYAYEPWHMRYVGVELATKLTQENLTLEEYYNQ
ncbi:MAG: D-alanyl-D-alanine carboxypeptidase family protein, partial [Coprobacillus sp.]